MHCEDNKRGSSINGGTNAPKNKGYTRIYSTGHAFAALRDDGSISAWGNVDHGGKLKIPPKSL
jgi:hypothetical protein